MRVGTEVRTSDTSGVSAPNWLVWSALWVVYLVWGSTYLAIRVTVETMPPLLSASVRFMLAGAVVLAAISVRRGRGSVRVTGPELLASAAIGTALLFGGNGMVSVAEQYVPSALTALIIASVPLWIIVMRLLTRERIAAGTLAGAAVGFVGVAILVLPDGDSGGASLGYSLLIVGASIAWATGSFFSKRVPLPKDPFLSTGMQMLTGGVVMGAAGLARGEASGLDVSSFSGASIAGLAYLVVFGSLLAFTAYVWLLQNAPISKVATYAYVNPVVAIVLGWLILSEDVTPVIAIGAGLIVASVAAIVRIESKPATRAAEGERGAAAGRGPREQDVVTSGGPEPAPVVLER